MRDRTSCVRSLIRNFFGPCENRREKMLTLYYSPHMTSVDNETGRASGHADVPLSTLGRQQAQELGQHYATFSLDAISCSDLQRASTTAQIAFAGQALPLVADARLREYDYGDLTQYPIAQVEEEFPRRITATNPRTVIKSRRS